MALEVAVQYVAEMVYSLVGLPKFGPEPRFEPRTAGPNLQVRVQVLLGGRFLRTGSNLEPKYII